MLIPSADQPFCYCVSKEREETMLSCQKCKKLFHLGCLQSGRPTTLLGDIFFELTCAVCNDGEELLSRMKMSWMQVVILAMYNLHIRGVSGKCGYYRWKEHICAFIDKHWNTFYGVAKKKSGNWKGTVAGTLSAGCPSYFQSGQHILNETGWWCLANVKPPTMDDSAPRAKLLNQQMLLKTEDEPIKESPVKGLRERRYKRSLEAAMELKAKREGTSDAGSRKRTFSASSCPDAAAHAPGPSCSAAKVMRIKAEPVEQIEVEPVEVELQTVVVKQEVDDTESSLVDELLRSASGDASDDDFEVDPCSLSPCASPGLMTSQNADVTQLLACIGGNEPIADFNPEPSTPSSLSVPATPISDVTPTPSDVTTAADVRATPSSDVIKSTVTSESEGEESEEEEGGASEEERVAPAQEGVRRPRFRPLSVYEEKHLYRKLDSLLENKTDDLRANRLLAKLRLRQIKRERGLPLFDLDARFRELTNQKGDMYQSELTNQLPSYRAGTEDRVLDRFQCSPAVRRQGSAEPLTFLQRLIGGADGQLTCIMSPYTTRYLKPYIRRDFQARPRKLKLLHDILAYPHRSDPSWRAPPNAPVDYCYVRPQHIPSINQLCHQFFWPGIDLSECLQYPDFSVVALYKKIVIGFGFLVPDVEYNQAYISFLFTHPDWRGAGLGTYMVYHLIQTCLGKDITLHVSATNPAMVLYQKFGFKPEQFVLDFYDKYYPYDSKECRHAFFMRLRR